MYSSCVLVDPTTNDPRAGLTVHATHDRMIEKLGFCRFPLLLV